MAALSAKQNAEKGILAHHAIIAHAGRVTYSHQSSVLGSADQPTKTCTALRHWQHCARGDNKHIRQQDLRCI